MSFKNNKEEVLDIQLTSYGKMLLSRGKFNPEFYAFFDDDIIYDVEYVDDTEEQNYAEIRILEETPRTQTQVVFEGLETQIVKQISDIRRGLNTPSESFQNTIEKEYALSSPLGKSALSTDNIPSWDITCYGSRIENKQTVNDTHPLNIMIPQINIEPICFYTEIEDTGVDPQDIEETGVNAGDKYPGHRFSVGGFQNVYDDGIKIELYENYLIIEMDEINTQSAKHNFDVELFIVEDVVTASKASIEDLIPLSFKKQFSPIFDGIYDEQRFQEEMERRALEPDDPTTSDHYFDIMVDKEIDPQVLCKVGYRTDFSKRGAIRVDCGDKDLGNTRMEDVYDPFGDSMGPYGDDC